MASGRLQPRVSLGPPPWRLSLLLLWLCWLLSVEWVRAALPWCGAPVDGSTPPSPTVPIPRVALSFLNSTSFDAASCTLSFDGFTCAHSDWRTCYHAPVFNVHTCPQSCMRAVMELRLPNATVYGSFPYAGNSSICLAAIHAGVLSDAAGGAVIVDRFYPDSWEVADHSQDPPSSTSTTDSSSAGELFPHAAWRATLSFGVQSLEVPAGARGGGRVGIAVDGDGGSSWAVRTRSLLPRQRQTAPFSPRSGHLHAWLYPQLQLRLNWSTGAETASLEASKVNSQATFNYSLHFVIGGHNNSHYMNDVSDTLTLTHTLTHMHTTASDPASPSHNAPVFLSLSRVVRCGCISR